MQKPDDQTLVISAIEARTPVGPSIDDSAAAVRAAASGFREHPEYSPLVKEDEEDYLISAGMDLSIKGYDWQRLIRFVEQPFLSFISSIGLNRHQMEKASLWFALPYTDSVIQDIGLQKNFIEQFTRHFALPRLNNITGVQLGSTGIIYLIDKAQQALSSGFSEYIILVAVDSYMLDGRMAYYDDAWRMKSERNPMGFIPGEAAVMMLLETRSHAESRNFQPALTLHGLGLGQENNTIEGNKSSTGQGLTMAIRNAVESGKLKNISWMYSDLNGEPYRAYEWGITNVRLNSLFTDELNHMHPADVMGDIGAATTGVQLGCIAHAFKEEYAESENVLLFAGNDSGQRAAITVSGPYAEIN
jgi:3-oxoacyl-[acyl-carrier-protein] synthase-1